MAIPQNKIELIIDINETFAKLEEELMDIPAELTGLRDLPGHAKGTMMSINNLVAYLIGWGQLVLKWHQKKEAGETVDFPETGYNWNQLGPLAQKFYTDYEELDYESLRQKLVETVEAILEVVEPIPDDTLYQTPWYGKYPFGRMVQLNTSSPFKNARTRIRHWRKSMEEE